MKATTVTTTSKLLYEFPADFESARLHFAHYLSFCFQIARRHGIRPLLRSEEELYALTSRERPGVIACDSADGKTLIAVFDMRRKDRLPVLYVNAEAVYEGMDPDRLLVEVIRAVYRAEKALEAAQAA